MSASILCDEGKEDFERFDTYCAQIELALDGRRS